MPIVTELNCPYCLRRIVAEDVKGNTLPLGMLRLHKIEDYYKAQKSTKNKMTPHRGLIGRRKHTRDSLAVLRCVRDLLGVEAFNDIPLELEKIIHERDKLKKKLEGMSREFSKKKLTHFPMIIRKRGKTCDTQKKGVLYFQKNYIGKKVIVWEKT